MRNAVHLDFGRNGDLLLYLLSRASRPLGNHLYPGIRDIRVRLDGQTMERNHAPDEEKKRNAQYNKAVLQRKIDKRANHCCSAEFWNSSAIATTCWPGAIPETS